MLTNTPAQMCQHLSRHLATFAKISRVFMKSFILSEAEKILNKQIK